MADYSKTVANFFAPVGPASVNLWGVMVWGVDTWGAGSLTLPLDIGKVLSNTPTPTTANAMAVRHLVKTEDLSPTTDNAKYVLHGVISDDISPTSETSKTPSKLISGNEITPTAEDSAEYLQDERGYFYNFPSEVTDLDERYTPTYTSGTTATSGWTTASVATTVWS